MRIRTGRRGRRAPALIRRLLATGAAALLLAACGGDDGRFDAQVDDVRSAVASGDREAALVALDDLSVAAMQAHADGAVDDAELQQLDGLLQEARRMVDEQLPAPTTTTETTEPAPPPPPPVAEVDDDDDDDEERGRGKGKKDDDDD